VETTPHINQGKEAIDMRHRKNCLVKERDWIALVLHARHWAEQRSSLLLSCTAP
jgi:hypothetical protein